MFFFANAEITESEQPTGWSLDGSSGQCFSGCDVQASAQRFRDILINNYGFDPGGLGENIRDRPSDKIFGRLDFNLGTAHQLTFRHNYVDAASDVNRPGSFTYQFSSNAYEFLTETNSTVFQLNSIISANAFNEARLAIQSVKDRRAGADGIEFPWIEIEHIDGSRQEFEAGTERFSTRNGLDQDILEINNDFTWIKGDHTIVLGTHNEIFEFDNLFIQNAFGSYEFDDLDELESGISERWNYTVVNPGQPETQQFEVFQLGLYAGDQWAVNSGLTLNYGLRIDAPDFKDSPSRNPDTEALYGIRTDEMPSELLIQPRVGFNWDIKNDGQHQLRGGIGVFAGRTPYVWISNQYGRTGIEQTFVTEFDKPFNPDPYGQVPSSSSGGAGEYNLIDPSFEFPQVLRTNLAYDTRLPWMGLVGSVEVIYTDSLKEINYQKLNIERAGNHVDGRPAFTRVSSTDAYLITNTSEGSSLNMALKVERPIRGGWGGFASYAYGDSEVVNEGSSSRAVSNWNYNEALDPNNPVASRSDNSVEHRFSASLTKVFNDGSRYPTTVSTFYNLQSGRPFSYLIQSDSFASINGDNRDSNDLFYVPSGPDDVIISRGTYDQLDAFINGSSCLSSSRGQITKRNCGESPWHHTLDLHVAQDIPVRSSRVQITFDILNLMNLLDDESGVLRYANFNSINLGEYQEIDAATGKQIIDLYSVVTAPEDNSLWTSHNINSRWRAKLGLRWSF